LWSGVPGKAGELGGERFMVRGKKFVDVLFTYLIRKTLIVISTLHMIYDHSSTQLPSLLS
jgi:hypothetical protein